MKVLIFVAAVLGAASMCTAITQDQVDQLMDLNFMFDILHKNYDHEINKAWTQQKHNMKVLNAQFLSRYGFNIDEMKTKEGEVLEAIEQRGEETGNPDSECIQSIRYGLTNAVGYANMNYAATVEEILFYFNQTNDSFFYPNVEIFHFQSNSFQWEILNALLEINPVADMSGLIRRLMADYYIILEMFEEAVNTLASDIREYDREFNRIRGSIFPTFQNVRDYFFFTCNSLKDSLSRCE
ncbi:unnamed protein product [Chironomus riparius]|uniref:Uncharacterized protein n=1 Tax=Chironomus riparius TaxID=315576 RepID=A0A9N9S0H7_9DIPT|nr:unnamed protein product [Chironomus riparius]